MRLIYLFLFVFCFSYFAFGGFVETVYTASLSNNQEVPLPQDPPPTAGTAVCVLIRNEDPNILDCEVQHNVEDVTAAGIHVAPRGAFGPAIYLFSTIANNFRESFKLEDINGYTADQQINDFLSGNWYINILSLEYPSGEIRGQIEHTDRFYSRLSTSNTIPHASGSSAKGIAVGGYSHNNPTRELSFDLVHSVQQPSDEGLEIRRGSPGIVGPLVYQFKDAVSPAYENVDYTISEEEDFFSDLHYLNLLSVNNPSGEIRGQMVTIDYVNEIAFTSRLDAESSIPPVNSNNRGAALFSYDCTTKIIEYVVMHNIPDARGAFIGAAPAGDFGITLFSLGRGASPIYGSVQLTPEEELLLYDRGLYVSVVSVEFQSGEIRGQITADFDWYAYLSGTNVVSPITTPAVGIATMRLEGEQNRRLNYAIFHNVELPLRATVNVAKEGENGPLDLIFASVFSPIRGDDIVLDDDELEAFVTDGIYFSVTSVDYPFLGEIRGQVKRINPCSASNDNSLTVSVSNGIVDDIRSNSDKALSLDSESSNNIINTIQRSESAASTISCVYSLIFVFAVIVNYL